MTMNRDLERLLDVWLDEGPTTLPNGGFDAAVAGLRRASTPQARRFDRRKLTVSTRLLAVAALLIALTALGVAALPGSPLFGPVQPTPTSSPTAPPPAVELDCYPGPCLGRLAPGRYTTDAFELPFSFTVPDGWANIGDQPQGYLIVDISDADPSDHSPDPSLAVAVYLDPYATSQDQCNIQPEPGVGGSAAELMAWLTSLPTLLASDPWHETIAGYDALVVDLSMAPGARHPCIDYVSLLNVPRVVSSGGAWLTLSSDEYLRMYLFDGPSEHTVLVGLWSQVSRNPSNQFGAAPQIVESLAFTP